VVGIGSESYIMTASGIRIFEILRFVTLRIDEKEQAFTTLQCDNSNVVKTAIIEHQDQ
jgi:hypothetical protein